MRDLKTLQYDFMRAIYEKNGFENYLQSPEYIENFDIYINNCYLGLVENLKSKFPICEKLLGNDYFSMICEKYIKANPLNFGHNNSFGDKFSTFLNDFLKELNLSFVHDIAKIEWAKFQSEISTFQNSIYFEEIQNSFQIGDYNNIKLRDCAYFIELSCNGFEIYFEQLNNEAKAPNPNYEAQYIVIYLNGDFEPCFKKLYDFQFEFLQGLYENKSFVETLNQILQNFPNKNLAQAEFVELCNQGIFTKN